MDGLKFLIKAGEFKKWSGLNKGLALKQTQVLTITCDTCGRLVVLVLTKTKMGKQCEPSQIMKIWLCSQALTLKRWYEPGSSALS